MKAYLNPDIELHGDIFTLDADFLGGIDRYDLMFRDIVRRPRRNLKNVVLRHGCED